MQGEPQVTPKGKEAEPNNDVEIKHHVRGEEREARSREKPVRSYPPRPRR